MIIDIIKKFNRTTIVLFLIIFQSIGIRFFDGLGTYLVIIIILLSIKSVFFLAKSDFFVLSFLLFFLFLNSIFNKNIYFSKSIFQYFLIIEVYLFLKLYRNPLLIVRDLYLVLLMFFFHAFLGYVLFLIIPSFYTLVNFQNISYLTLGNFFFLAFSERVARNTGLCWEPGLLQLILNIFLLLSITSHKKWILLIIIICSIITCYSTAGFFLLVLNLSYYFYLNTKRKNFILPIFIITSVLLLSFSIIETNITNKIDSKNASGAIRYRDILIGINLIMEKPILGHGPTNEKLFKSRSSVSKIEERLFSQVYLNRVGTMSGGYTNGFLGLIIAYGLPMSLLAYYFFFKNKIFTNKSDNLVFCLIIIGTFMSEPITYTAFFLILPLSYFVFKKSNVVSF